MRWHILTIDLFQIDPSHQIVFLDDWIFSLLLKGSLESLLLALSTVIEMRWHILIIDLFQIDPSHQIVFLDPYPSYLRPLPPPRVLRYYSCSKLDTTTLTISSLFSLLHKSIINALYFFFRKAQNWRSTVISSPLIFYFASHDGSPCDFNGEF